MKARARTSTLVDEIVGEFSTPTWKPSELFELLLKHRVPCAPVRTLEDVVTDPHLHERGMLQWVEHPTLGRIVVPGSPMRYEGAAPMPHAAKLGARQATTTSCSAICSACPRPRSANSRSEKVI